ncbi:glycerophosphoryl diester phosphodiesterase membrane domain-containing protein [Novosphingobium sediminicola]|uniref:DUF7847 domain-containing protein n=1 Tax=Novosphingobium sediminicola TaxID=563162 RepID=A0A7W6CF87_9SPHN|nr:glycerophosphoryl diester phosphodiesterase membrane domain-containing protein [Novosphingobium sediminicola]MBB3955458.1 hypothetical protein [Novosphingobium sediminicola]
MRFDSNLAWRTAHSAILANRDVLLALAGVFFLLPRLAFALLMPDPPAAQGASPAQSMQAMEAFYATALPYVIPMILFQAVGVLAILTLFTDRSRPTVGQALSLGAKGVFPYVLAQIMLAAAIAMVGGGLIGVLALTKQPALAGGGMIVVMIVAIAAYIRMSLVGPVVAVERVYNPARALMRSWAITRGNGWRLLGFALLVGVVVMVAMVAVVSIGGSIGTLAGGPDTGRIISAVVSSLLAAMVTLYIAGLMAAIHRQLAGPSVDDIMTTFE